MVTLGNSLWIPESNFKTHISDNRPVCATIQHSGRPSADTPMNYSATSVQKVAVSWHNNYIYKDFSSVNEHLLFSLWSDLMPSLNRCRQFQNEKSVFLYILVEDICNNLMNYIILWGIRRKSKPTAAGICYPMESCVGHTNFLEGYIALRFSIIMYCSQGVFPPIAKVCLLRRAS